MGKRGGGGHKGKRGGGNKRNREPGGYARKDGDSGGYKEVVRENDTMVNYYKVSISTCDFKGSCQRGAGLGSWPWESPATPWWAGRTPATHPRSCAGTTTSPARALHSGSRALRPGPGGHFREGTPIHEACAKAGGEYGWPTDRKPKPAQVHAGHHTAPQPLHPAALSPCTHSGSVTTGEEPPPSCVPRHGFKRQGLGAVADERWGYRQPGRHAPLLGA